MHGALERGLIERIGPELGGRLRAGRSRNDQIATLIRLYLRDALAGIGAAVLEVVDALRSQAERHLGVPMPGRTHLQHAQPVLLSHHLLAHAWPLLRDRHGSRSGSPARDQPVRVGRPRRHIARSRPGGCRRRLGFSGVSNSIDGTAARDLVAEAASSWLRSGSTSPD